MGASGGLGVFFSCGYEQIVDTGDVQLDIGEAMEYAIATEKRG